MKEKQIGFGGKIGYGVGDLGCNLLSGAAGSFITMYYTDSVLMGAAFIGTMMLFTRVLDGVSDIIMGSIIDRTHTKLGKARPWLIISLIPLIISFILLFNVPSGLSTVGKEIYVIITYIFNGVFCYTAVNMSYSTLCTMMSPNPNVRMALSSTRMFFSSLAVLIANSYTVALMSMFGGGQKGFTMMSAVYGLIAFVCILITFIVCKEYHIESKEEIDKKEKVLLKESVRIMFGNKYTLPLTLGFVFNWLILVLNGASMVFYARDVIGNIGNIAKISLAGSIPAMVVLAIGIVPMCVAKFGKRQMLILGAIFEIVGFIIMTSAPYNMVFIIAGNITKSVGIGFVNSLLFASVADVADYINIKNKVHMAGLTNSITSFGMKVGVGLGSAVFGWMLAWGGYSAELANNMLPQSDKTILAERLCFSGIPIICAVIVLIMAFLIDVEEKLKKLKMEY